MPGTLKLNSGGAGNLILTPSGSVGSDVTLTLPASTATLATVSQIQGPAFSANKNQVNQSISQNTWTKVTFAAEEFDTASCFDTTNSRFTPNVAGYYQISVDCYLTGSASDLYAQLYKNGSGMLPAVYVNFSVTTTGMHLAFSNLMYMNGTTDYIELYAYSNGASPSVSYSGTHLQGFLART